jgi:hypothetical protein
VAGGLRCLLTDAGTRELGVVARQGHEKRSTDALHRPLSITRRVQAERPPASDREDGIIIWPVDATVSDWQVEYTEGCVGECLLPTDPLLLSHHRPPSSWLMTQPGRACGWTAAGGAEDSEVHSPGLRLVRAVPRFSANQTARQLPTSAI